MSLNFSDRIRWPEEWEKKSLAEVKAFLRKIKNGHCDLSEREADFLLAIAEKYNAWVSSKAQRNS